MTRVRFLEGNQIYRYFRLDEYNETSATSDEIVLDYDSGNGPYDPAQRPFSIVMTVEGGVLDGGTYTAGTITRVEFRDDAGQLLVRYSQLDIDASVYSTLSQGDGLRDFFFDHLSADDGVYIGSRDAGPEDGNQGDSITTGGGDDTVRSGQGDDLIKDAGGTDMYRGGSGSDWLSYQLWNTNRLEATDGITVRLNQGFVTGPDGNTDTVTSIENVIGTELRDSFVGNGRANTFMGFAGNDYFNGRGSYDTVSYRIENANGGNGGIVANMETNRVIDTFGDTDRLRNIEGIEGTNRDDVFIDGSGPNTYLGFGGDDEFRLAGGSDYIEGGAGADSFIFRDGSVGETRIRDYDPTEGDTLRIEGLTDFADLEIRQSGSGENAVVEFEGLTIILREYDSTLLTADDFGL